MKHMYLVETEEELLRYQHFVRNIRKPLEDYLSFLKEEFAVRELPRAILWTSGETATREISSIPLPAYTNDFRTVITPDLSIWRTIYLKQLKGLEAGDASDKIRTYYETCLNRNHILQILGHELAHHSELFPEDFDSALSDGIWFEEGMVEYISRKYFLSREEFDAEAEINRLLVDLLRDRYGNHSLEEFGAATYEGDYASIFYEYWRSFLAVNKIIDSHGGNIHSVFQSYRKWIREQTGQSLAQWFDLED